MHFHILDSYQPRQSLIHLLDARLKLLITLAFILTTALTPVGVWSVFILLFALILAAVILSELVLAALPVIFTLEGDPGFRFLLGPWTLTVYGAGVERFFSIALKSWISVQAAIILASTAPFPELLIAMRFIGIPRLLVAVFSLMWRYLFVLVDEALRLIRARSSRSGHSDLPNLNPGGRFAWRARVTGGMAGGLFLRAFDRSDRIYKAMLARGYDGEVRTAPLPKLKLSDWLILAIILVLFTILLVFALFLQQ
jgi:cobalt/nickel transport system permease protein